MKKLALLLAVLLLVTLVLAACDDKPDETQPSGTLPSAIASEKSPEPTQASAQLTTTATPEHETPAATDAAASQDSAPVEDEDTEIEIVDNYSVTVNGTVGFGGND